MIEMYNHFLDTNVVLAMILPNDTSKDRSIEYFNTFNNKKYFSHTAYEEAKNVINKLRRISLKIIKCIENYLTKKNS